MTKPVSDKAEVTLALISFTVARLTEELSSGGSVVLREYVGQAPFHEMNA